MSGKSTVGVTRFGLAPARQVSPGFKPGPIKPEVSDADAFVTPSQPPPPTRGPGESPLPLEGALKRWFDEEVETLQRLAHTQRLKGDYVAAQTMEREIRQLTRQTAAVLERGHSGGR